MLKLAEYCEAALKRSEIKSLGPGEGYSAKLPGFPGLLVFGSSRREVMTELRSALEGWVELSLARGDGLPSLHQEEGAAA